MNLKIIVLDNDTKGGKVFDFFIQFLIILSLVAFSIETIPNLEIDTLRILNTIEIITVTIFTIEYLLRAFLTKKTLSYIFSFYGIIDFIAILPFWARFRNWGNWTLDP